MLKLSFENMIIKLNIFNLQRQPAIFESLTVLIGLMYMLVNCNDSCADSLIEDEICDEIDYFPLRSSDPSSSVTHTSDPTLELKPLPNSLKYVFLDLMILFL